MENITECSGLETKPKFLIGNIATSSFLSLISLYTLLALVYYETRVEKAKQIGLSELPIEKRYSVLSKYACISFNIAAFLLYISLVSYWSVEGIETFNRSNQTVEETVCAVFNSITNVAVTGGNGLVYLFLWLRQRAIYVYSSLKVLNNKYVSIFSFAVLILWILFSMSLVIAYFIKV